MIVILRPRTSKLRGRKYQKVGVVGLDTPADLCHTLCMREILFGGDYRALVDDKDFAWLSEFKWHTLRKPGRVEPRTAISREVDGKNWYRTMTMGRLVMGDPDGADVDHINRNPLDNRRENLRLCSRSQNAMNRGKNRSWRGGATSSKYRGVYRKRCMQGGGKWGPYYYWVAYIKAEGKQKSLGHYKTELEAAKAYDAGAKKYFGEFASLNFPD